MTKVITKITDKDYIDRFSYLKDVSELPSEEDIATLLDTFRASGLKGYNIVKIIEDNGKYIFVYTNEDTGFDFFEEINRLSTTGIKVSCNNAVVQFPQSKSRGYFTVSENSGNSEEYSTGELETYSDESPTGFMGDDEISELSKNIILIHLNSGSKLPINDNHGVIIGRSSQLSEFTVPNTKVSRKHARVYKEGTKVKVHDYDSANGTTIDGLKVLSTLDRELPIDSILRLANEEFKLVCF